MSSPVSLGQRLMRRRWPISDVAPGHLAYLLLVDAAVLVWATIELARFHPSAHALGVLALVVLVALGYEEGATRAARLRLRLSLDLKRDMMSVWAVAAAVAMPAGSAVVLMIVVLTYVWFRQQRPAGQPLHRKWFNGSTELLGCLCAGALVRLDNPAWASLPWHLGGAVDVVLAATVYSLVNRLLVTGALLWIGVRGKALLGGKDDNLIELATLCLGGLVAVALLHQYWLVLLALVPMISLQRGSMVRELETVATTDAKTGLLNAIALEHLGQREVARAEREHTALAVLIIDIDRFKLVNDRYGHLVGDAVLRGVGKVLTSGVREYDTVGRFGGEEFLAVLPAASESEALLVAERLRASVQALRVSGIDSRVEPVAGDGLSISIGVACFGVDGDAMPELLFAADSALYRAKESGRNRVVLADRGPGERELDTVRS